MAISKNQPMRSAEIDIVDSLNSLLSDYEEMITDLGDDLDDINNALTSLNSSIETLSAKLGNGFTAQFNASDVIGVTDYIDSGASASIYDIIEFILETLDALTEV